MIRERMMEDAAIILTAHEALTLSDRRRRIAQMIMLASREVVEAVERAMQEANS